MHYDETFRALRSSQGWQWDVVHSELWLQAAQPVSSSRMAPLAFQDEARRGAGMRGERSTGVCFAFNKGQPCVQSPCPARSDTFAETVGTSIRELNVIETTKAHLPSLPLKNKIATPISVEALKPYPGRLRPKM